MSASQPANLVRVVRTSGLCILRQLRLEEKLLRSPGAGNWCLLNDGTPDRAVVLGISGKPHQLVDVRAARDDGVRVIKRFSGGGTVIVDRDTQFVTLVMNAAAVPNLPLFPRQIMDWTGALYGGSPHGIFADVPGWRLRENDYVVDERKVGRPLGEGVLWRYAIQLLVGLHAIHRRRVVHRDIKPHNIFLGAGDTVKIGDFGVSKLLSSTMPLANTFVGSPGYLAPELCNGEPRTRTRGAERREWRL